MGSARLILRHTGASHLLVRCFSWRPSPQLQAARSASTSGDDGSDAPATGLGRFDTRMLEAIGDPFTKKTLRYDAKTHTLISDSLGVAFPIDESGIPNLHPRAGKVLEKEGDSDQEMQGEPVQHGKGPSSQ